MFENFQYSTIYGKTSYDLLCIFLALYYLFILMLNILKKELKIYIWKNKIQRYNFQ